MLSKLVAIKYFPMLNIWYFSHSIVLNDARYTKNANFWPIFRGHILQVFVNAPFKALLLLSFKLDNIFQGFFLVIISVKQPNQLQSNIRSTNISNENILMSYSLSTRLFPFKFKPLFLFLFHPICFFLVFFWQSLRSWCGFIFVREEPKPN